MNNTPQPSSPAVPETPVHGADPAGINIPLSPKRRRRGIVLAALALAWFAFALYAASTPPGSGWFVYTVAIGAALLLIGAWLAIGAWSLFLRRPMGVLGWCAVPLAIALFFWLPWGHWFLAARVRAHESELRLFAGEQAGIPDRTPRPLDAKCAGIQFEQVTRFGSTIVLACSHHPDGESGLLYAPSDAAPTPPDWAKTSHTSRITTNWFRYVWRND